MGFYNENVDFPLSAFLDRPEWGGSKLGKLHEESGGAVFVRKIPRHVVSMAPQVAWRVTDAFYTQEDSQITYFRAYDSLGDGQPFASFGVHWNGSPHRIAGGFDYEPEFGNNYYVPVENKFVTVNSSGYTVQVLDDEYPSEGLSFGMAIEGQGKSQRHKCLVVVFRLMMLDERYPHDYEAVR
jgi:hypothetical protein